MLRYGFVAKAMWSIIDHNGDEQVALMRPPAAESTCEFLTVPDTLLTNDSVTLYVLLVTYWMYCSNGRLDFVIQRYTNTYI